jgi:hypothetical protein
MAYVPTQQDVLLALLAFDSYNRGANPQMTYAVGAELSTTIGTATLQLQSDRLAGATDAGFSASSYSLNGAKVISFRGTDFPTSFWDINQLIGFATDVWNGWGTSFGAIGTGGNTQPAFAQKFYELVSENPLFPAAGDPPGAVGNLILTGHSLGGSLAGFIGAISQARDDRSFFRS